MSPEVSELFHQLVDLSPEARVRYLAEHPVDIETRREVEELLAYDSGGVHTLTLPIALAAQGALVRLDARGTRCGAFQLMSVIGRGGMGVVYLAERVDGEVTQRAAVKLMQPGWNEAQRERFLKEREILAALSHPNIAHLLDAGHLDDGQPYLAMEYVQGEPIDRYCEGLGVRQKIELFQKVCAAVTYLHDNLVVHRDLKPNNILLLPSGEPKLLDFGIAKLLEMGGDATATHMRMLTPGYASPEQVSGGVVGKSSDIYSLGAVLHFLLTGKPPQESPPGVLAPELKGDLDLILRKALREEPEERYASVEEFAGDLWAYLDSRPIHARQGDLFYRARKSAGRYWLMTALAGAVATTLVSAGLLAWHWSRPTPPHTDLNPVRLTANTPELPIQAAAISPDGTHVAYSDSLGLHVRSIAGGETRLLPSTSGHVLVKWMDGASLQTQLRAASGETSAMAVSLAGGVPTPAATPVDLVVSPDGKYRARAAADHQGLLIQDENGENSREIWRSTNRTLDAFQFRPDSKQIAIVSSDRTASTIESIDLAGGQKNVLIAADQNLSVASMVWPSPKRMIAMIWHQTGPNSYTTNLWEVRLNAGGAPERGGLRKITEWTDFPIRTGSLTTDGKNLVFVRRFAQRDVYVAEINASRSRLGTPRRLTLDLGDDYPTAWTSDSKAVILSSDRKGRMSIYRQDLDKQTAEPLANWKGSQILPRVSPDRKSILFWSSNPATRVPRLMRVPMTGGTAEPLWELPDLLGFRCSPAGPCTAAQRKDKGYILFEADPVKGIVREILRDANDPIGSTDISPDGKWLASLSRDRIVLRSFATGAIVREIPVQGARNLVGLDYAPDGKGFFLGDTSPMEARALYVNLSGATSVLWRQPGNSYIWGIPSPDGKHLALMLYTDDSNVYMVKDF